MKPLIRSALTLACSVSLLLGLAGLTPAAAAPAAVFNVTTTADGNNGSCGSPCTLRDAVTAANGASGSTINVPAGTYTLSMGVLTISASMTITGAGRTTTILDGNHASQVFNITIGTVNISGVTIQHAHGPGAGGGIMNAGSLTLDTVTLQDNQADNAGGGVVAWNGGSLTIVDSIVTHNHANNAGGGISGYDLTDNLTITNCSIISNTAGTAAGIDSVGPFNISGSSITDNVAAGYGGGLRGLDGGTLTDSTVSGNQSNNHGGGLSLGNPSTSAPAVYVISSSTISNNTDTGSVGFGGGLDVFGSSTTVNLVNSTISSNHTLNSGGGVGIYYGQLKLYNTSVAGNTAMYGGGIYVYPSFGQAAHLLNSLLGGNSGNSGSPDCSGLVYSDGYDLIQHPAGCTLTLSLSDVLNQDPVLGPLQNNGGPTATQALLIGSPAINAGDPAGCKDQNGAILTADQRGLPRPNATTRCDIGSYENQSIYRKLYLPVVQQ